MKSTNSCLSMLYLKFISILIICLLLYNCDSTNVDDKLQVNENYVVIEDDYTFIVDAEKYKDTELKRAKDDFCQVKTNISKVAREDNILIIEILKPKNCELKYEVIWDGLLLESYPMQGAIFVHSITDTNCNEGAEKETDTLVINLEEALKTLKKDIIENTNFTVRDACSLVDVNCSGNCNEVITD